MKLKLKTEGLTGDNLAFVEQLNKRFAELPEGITKEEVGAEVRSALGDFLGEDGKPKFDVAALAELLGDGEKGIRTILKKQGEEITALKEAGKEGKVKNFRAVLNEKLDEAEKLFKSRSKSGEVRFSIKLAVRAAAAMTTANTIDEPVDMPDDIIESFSIGQFVPKRHPREYVFDIANRRTVTEITEYKTWLEEGDEEGAFAIVDEGGLKPLVSMKLVRNTSEYQKVAGKYVVTEEFAKFRKEAYNIIKRLINQKFLRDYSSILTTNLLNDAASYVSSALDDQFDNPTDYHAIAAVAAQIEGLDFMPDVLIMNPQDKWRIGMSQDSNGQFYLTIPITDPSGQTRMMGFLVRTSTRVSVGNFILGESNLWEVEDEGIQVRMGYGITVTEDGEGAITAVEADFDHNRFRVIVETFFHNYIASNNTGSFVYGNFDTIKALLQKPEEDPA